MLNAEYNDLEEKRVNNELIENALKALEELEDTEIIYAAIEELQEQLIDDIDEKIDSLDVAIESIEHLIRLYD